MTLQEAMGQRVRHRRMEQHATQRDLATRVAWQPDYLSRFEQGKWTAVDPARLVTLADALQVSIDWLCTGKEGHMHTNRPYTPGADPILDALLTPEQKPCTHPHVTPIEPPPGSSAEYHHSRCEICQLVWRTERPFRVFQGMQTRQVDGVSGKPAADLLWYWEPRDYEGDTLWSAGYPTRDAAIDAALAEEA
jgi:transcriptional regulator with XRE-family HTH domain